jgi:hypothetical protein
VINYIQDYTGGYDMGSATLKERLIEDIGALPGKTVREVADFVDYLKLREDRWFLDYADKRAADAKAQKKAGKKFIRLEELQKERQ